MGATVVFSLSCVCGSDLFLIQMGETQVTLQSAIDLTTLTILAVYGVKYVKNLSEYAGITERVPEVKEILPELADRSVGTDEESKG